MTASIAPRLPGLALSLLIAALAGCTPLPKPLAGPLKPPDQTHPANAPSPTAPDSANRPTSHLTPDTPVTALTPPEAGVTESTAPSHPQKPEPPIAAQVEVTTKPAEAPPASEPLIKTVPARYDWLSPARWADLPGWRQDDLTQAWPAFLQSCRVLRRQSAWQTACTQAEQAPPGNTSEAVREWFERQFNVYRMSPGDGSEDGLVTGYYEPLLNGSRKPDARHRFPLYAPPEDLIIVDLASLYPEIKNLRLRGRMQGNKLVPYYTRGEIGAGLAPLQGKEIAWVDDPIELFFLQVQGSGRLRLESGDLLRIGYADQNGHPYRSIGKWLVENGELTLDKASMQGIKDWARRNPDKLAGLLAANPSYVFFRELPETGGGPLGALGVPLTPERSIAVDPRALPLGAPVWLATTQPNASEALNRLMLAQDTGGAIRGNVRADYFWGFGDEAGQKAGAMKQRGRMWLLLPRNYPLIPAETLATVQR